MVTTAAVLLDEQHLVLFTIQHNGDGTPEFQQAIQMLRSVDLQAAVPSPMGSREIHALARAEPAVRP